MEDFEEPKTELALNGSETSKKSVNFEEGDDHMDFGAMLKKKNKKKKVIDLTEFERELEVNESSTAAEKLDELKLDSEDESYIGNHHLEDEDDQDSDQQLWLNSDRDYYYPELLTRFYRFLKEKNPQLADKHGKYRMMPPSIGRDGNKKTIFANIADISKRMRRSPEHVTQFLFAELGTNGSVDGNARLVIKGRFQQKQIENILRRYVSEYVFCKTCKSYDTNLSKANRLYFLNCNSCGSRRSVVGIKTGFQAQIGKRKLLAAKQN